MNIYKLLSTLNKDRVVYLSKKAKQVTLSIDNIISNKDDKFTMFEVFYIISLGLLALLNSLGKEALGTFTEVFNQMTIIAEHRDTNK